MALRRVVVRLDTSMPIAVAAETELTPQELEKAASDIWLKLMNDEDGWNEQKILTALEQSGFIKNVRREPIEVINIEVI